MLRPQQQRLHRAALHGAQQHAHERGRSGAVRHEVAKRHGASRCRVARENCGHRQVLRGIKACHDCALVRALADAGRPHEPGDGGWQGMALNAHWAF